MIDQHARSVLVRQLLCPSDKLDDVATVLAVAETPIPIDGRRHDQASSTLMLTDRTGTTQLRAGLFQSNAEPVADVVDADLVAEGFEIQPAIVRHVHTSLC